ncbi:LacI family DNA-binding transcriptional regulator [Microbacterium elymi]|uniref:LacI family transcriptional regulator n=1 Tax=Microbacterium elymi TaxID=2909587 RepID=A0ABY5NIP6_9MICO|nr:LacI family DNA-binding transcriptional regulator [Microbacterium elymi]UUT35045.1 LacI family transcriptional regulator [Microbacterium elymi]
MVTIRDVAARAGVSAGTVSNVLNRPGYVAAETRERVLQVIADVGFTPTPRARRFRTGRQRTLGLALADLANPFFVDIALGAESEAKALGVGVVMIHNGEDAAREQHNLDLLVQRAGARHHDHPRARGGREARAARRARHPAGIRRPGLAVLRPLLGEDRRRRRRPRGRRASRLARPSHPRLRRQLRCHEADRSALPGVRGRRRGRRRDPGTAGDRCLGDRGRTPGRRRARRPPAQARCPPPSCAPTT